MNRVRPAYAREGIAGKPPRLLDARQRTTYLEDLYNRGDFGGGYGGTRALYDAVKKAGAYTVSFDEIKEFLRTKESYTAFKRVRKNFKRPRVIVSDKNQQWDCDTLNLSFYTKYNEGYSHVLVCIDIFTRYLFTRALKNLKADSIKEAFAEIFAYNEPPKSIRTDLGSEFANSVVKNFFAANNIRYFNSLNEVKSNYAERVIQTLRVRIGRAMKARHTFNWTDALQDITIGYNESKHRMINCTPLEAMCLKERALLWHWQYLRNDAATETGNSAPFALDVGDRVRLSYLPKTFRDRAYDEKWGSEIFTITRRKMSQGFQKYYLKDMQNEPVLGSFYKEELVKTDERDDGQYQIEAILGERYTGRGRNRKLEYKIKWRGWPKKYNSWIPAEDVVDL